jgi:Flp pilus assembly protein TadG
MKRVMSDRRLRRLPAKLMGNRSGAAAAEFALIIPVLTSMIFGALEFSSIFFSYSALQSAARDVTRQVAINTIEVGAAEAAVRARVPGWMRDEVDVQIVQSAPADITANVIQLTAEVPATSATPLKFFTKSADWDLQTVVEMKQETPFEEPEE